MVSLERFDIVFVAGENILLDTLAQAVFADGSDHLFTVLFLCVDPSDDLVHRLQIIDCIQILALDHGFSNGVRILLQLLNHERVIEDTTRNLAMSSSQTKNQVKGGFLLDVIIAQGATIF
eukprot:CAMPEP_0168187296 /NCGR_PEP_ID=MMETSP0139_2-20121125/14948_1 /TAXON_ID=44445 /ORGANISM="Pseudo-nitzschia australis, Strain 10249 10 AB" /LENGTH=119 /DNA_ID=CAMNT_0008109477 /DNA_START=281 /DNA_END=640 /DNA_ORIENTATION=-